MIHTVSGFAAFLVLTGVLFALRHRLGLFASTVLFTLLAMLWLRFGFAPPLPGSILIMFGGTLIVAVLLYVTSSEAGRDAFWAPIRAMMLERRRRPLLYAALAVIPAAVAWQSYAASLFSSEPPPLIRSVHPSPPGSIEFAAPGAKEAKKIDLLLGDNPYRELEGSNPTQFKEKIAHGKIVYYENCFYCHGDKLIADGHLARAMSPPPQKFNAGVLPLFQETFFFWRIAKGGPGLPSEGTPWDSTMPVWETMLTEDDIWSVLTYLYDRQGLRPRKQEAAGAH